jgi:hypothetical protein
MRAHTPTHTAARSPSPTLAPLALLIIALALTALYAVPSLLATILHPLLGLASHGTSSGKIFLLLAFVAIFASTWLVRALRQPRASTTPPAPPQPARRRLSTARIFIIASAAGLCASLASFFFYARAHHLATGDVTVHWSAGLNSSNNLTHIHTSKAVVALTLDALGLSHLHARFDTGQAYTSSIPTPLALLTGLCFVIATIAGLALGTRHAARSLREQPAPVAMAHALVIAIALQSISKCILDGGPLAYDALAGVLAAWAMLRTDARPRTTLAWARRRWAVLTLLVFSWLGLVLLLSPATLDFQAINLIFRLALYASIIALGHAAASLTRASPPAPLAAQTAARWAQRMIPAASTLAALGLTAWSVLDTIRLRIAPLFAPPPGAIVYHAPPTYQIVAPPHSAGGASFSTLAHAYAATRERPHRVTWTSALAGTSPVNTGFFAEIIVLDGPPIAPALARSGLLDVAVGPPERREGPQPSPIATPYQPQPPASPARTPIRVTFRGPAAPVLFRDAPHNQADENEKFVAYRLLDAHLRDQGVTSYILIPSLSFREKPAPHATAGSATAARSSDATPHRFTPHRFTLAATRAGNCPCCR